MSKGTIRWVVAAATLVIGVGTICADDGQDEQTTNHATSSGVLPTLTQRVSPHSESRNGPAQGPPGLPQWSVRITPKRGGPPAQRRDGSSALESTA